MVERNRIGCLKGETMDVSRRNFVGSGIVAVAGAGLLGTLRPVQMAKAVVATNDTFEGASVGVGGNLDVSIEMADGKLSTVSRVTFNETSGIGTVAWDRLTKEMVTNQAARVDAVTGATITSSSIVSAVTDALDKAGAADISEAIHEFAAPAQSDMNVDAVVVGAGHSGLFAALCLAEEGLSVVVLEKTGIVGGTALRSCAILGPDMSQRGVGLSEPVYQKLAELAINLQPTTISEYMTVPEPEQGKSPACTLTSAIADALTNRGGIILTDVTCTGLVIKNGSVIGVTAQPLGQDEFTVSARAVVLATGGWACNPDMVRHYLPQYAGVPACCGVGSTGDLYTWIEGLDASSSAMDSDAHFYPIATARPTHGFEPFTFPHNVNSQGDTFSDFMNDDYAATARLAALQDYEAPYYAIYGASEAEEMGIQASLDAQVRAGVTNVVSTFDEIVGAYGLTNLEAAAAKTGLSTDDGPYYVTEWKPAMYSTYGGLDLDEGARVTKIDGTVIPGLYGVGEAAGNEGYRQTGMYGGQLFPGLVLGLNAANAIAEDLA